MLGRCRDLSLVYSSASEDTSSLTNTNCSLYGWVFPSACADWAFFALFPPIFHLDMYSLFLLLPVDIWIIAPSLAQRSSWHPCLGKAASPAHRLLCFSSSGFRVHTVLFNLYVQNQCLKSKIQELVLKKLAVVSALPLESKAVFRVTKMLCLKPGMKDSSTF